jgi:sec-independent protein translocase protein TatC
VGIFINKKRSDDKRLTLLGHLQELRQRITYSVIFLVITIAVSFVFAEDIFDFLISRAPENVDLVFIEVAEKISIYMKVCLYSGIVLAMPFLIYQMVMFIRPALTRKERGYLYLLMPAVMLCFLGGAAFAYYVFLPRALGFLLEGNYLTDVEPMIRIGNYVSFVVQIVFYMGLVFELPVIMFFLAKIGVVSHKWLGKQRKWAFVAAFILAAIITPTPDPINQTIVAVPIILLYELSIWLAWFARRKPATVPAEGET